MRKKIKRALLDKDFSELFKKGSMSFFIRIGGQVLGMILTMLIARLFGAKGLGDYVLAITVLRLFSMLAKLGLDTSSVRFIAAFAVQHKWSSIAYLRKQIRLLVIFTTVAFSLLMYFLAEPIANLIHTNPKYIEWNAFLVLPISFFVLNYQGLRGLKRIAEFSFFYRMGPSLFSILAILLLYQFSHDKEIPVYSFLISTIVVTLLSYFTFQYWLNRKSKGKESAEFHGRTYKEIFAISLPLILAQSVQYIMAWTDKLMLGAIEPENAVLSTSEQVGMYQVAFRMSMFATISLMAINSIASPKFAEMYEKKDINGIKKVAQQSTKLIFWTTLPLVAVFFIFPKFFLNLFGSEFGKHGVSVFILLSCGKMISAFSGSVGNLLQMTGHQVMYMWILLTGAIMNVVLNMLLIPKYGAEGAAFASMCSLSFWNLAMVYYVYKKLGFVTFYIPFLKR